MMADSDTGSRALGIGGRESRQWHGAGESITMRLLIDSHAGRRGVLALRASHHGAVGEPAPAHPHLFRHARVRQIVRDTRSLPLAQRQAGWSRLQMAYLTLGDDEARQLMRQVTE